MLILVVRSTLRKRRKCAQVQLHATLRVMFACYVHCARFPQMLRACVSLCLRSAPKGGSTRKACCCFFGKQPKSTRYINKKVRRKAHQTDNLAKLRLEFLSVLELIAKDWLCGSTKKILSKGKGFCKRKIRAKRHGFSWWRGVDSNHRSH